MLGGEGVLSSDSLPVEHTCGWLLGGLVDGGRNGDYLDSALVLGRWTLHAAGAAAAGRTLARRECLRLSHVPTADLLAIRRNRLITHIC